MAKRKKGFKTPVGMHDILPEDQPNFQKILATSQNVAQFYGFLKIDPPVLEESDLFSKGIGLTTDIVEKQMYHLKTKGGDLLALRPEFTAGIARAYLEHGMFNLPQPVKLYSEGPLFRYEHPQAGRYRQFHQFDLEVFGEEGAVIDAQLIQIFYNILKELKFKNILVEVNSIGDGQCRPYYKKLLVNYLKNRESALCSNCRRRIRENPLRALDCKEEKCHQVISQSPQIIDHLCDGCHKHFKEVLEFLDEVELPYSLNPYLVRGLDYYTKTVFEIFVQDSRGEKVSKDALAGGGRFDNLLKLLGRRDIPACGGALGIDRVAAKMKESPQKYQIGQQPKVFLAQLGELSKRKSLKLFEEFRAAKIPVAESLGKDSLKTQLRIADKLGADFTLIFGQKEALEGTMIIRDMKKGSQSSVKIEKVIGEIKKRLKK